VLGKRAAIDALPFRGLPQPGLDRIENELAEGIPASLVGATRRDQRLLEFVTIATLFKIDRPKLTSLVNGFWGILFFAP
jgi:hypothetical protein